jgi:putative transposase
MNKEFDYQKFEREALERLKSGGDLGGKDGILAPLIKRLLETSLEGEMDAHLSTKEPGNRRNGKLSKQLKTKHGPIELKTPRDREGSFEPEIVPKRKTTLGDGLDEKILALYGMGMSYQDIRSHLVDLYGLEVSAGFVNTITDKVIPVLQDWQSRPLDPMYCMVWMDAIHYKVRQEGRVVNKAVYCVLGIDDQGMKDVLGIYLGESEGAKFWLGVLTDLSNRGVKDILIACIDNLSGFSEAIESIFPKTDVQLCIVHQVRNSYKYVAHKEKKEFGKDLRAIYQASNIQGAEKALDELESKWQDKYPVVIRSWRNNWILLSRYFNYPPMIRRMVYTTNLIEGFHRQLRKVTKTKGAFTSDMGLMKLLFLAQSRLKSTWSSPVNNWPKMHSQLSLYFDGRLKPALRG